MSGAVLANLGVVLSVGAVLHVGSPQDVGSYVVGTLAPTGFGLFLVLAGAWVVRCDLSETLTDDLLTATVGGLVLFGLVAVAVTLQLLPTAWNSNRAILVILDFASVGGTVGFLAGLVYVRQTETVKKLEARERALSESRNEYQDLFNGIVDPVIVHDADGDVLAVNDAATERLGYDAEQFHSMRLGDVEVEETDAAKRYANLQDDGVRVFESVYETADGDELPVEISARFIRYRGMPAVLTVARDLRTRKEYERELERKNEQLATLNRVVRHDIRNDMQLVLGMAQALETELEAGVSEELETIIGTSRHVVELTESVRDIIQTVADDEELTLQPIPLDATVREEVEKRRKMYEDAQFTVEEVPSVDVTANSLLSSVFRNVLNNAVLHSDEDTPRVVVSGVQHNGRVRVRIADNGPGIPDEQKRSVFGKDEKGIESQGTGIGLYLVSMLVDEYGGRVWITDNVPRGTVVNIDLPVAE